MLCERKSCSWDSVFLSWYFTISFHRLYELYVCHVICLKIKHQRSAGQLQFSILQQYRRKLEFILAFIKKFLTYNIFLSMYDVCIISILTVVTYLLGIFFIWNYCTNTQLTFRYIYSYLLHLVASLLNQYSNSFLNILNRLINSFLCSL